MEPWGCVTHAVESGARAASNPQGHEAVKDTETSEDSLEEVQEQVVGPRAERRSLPGRSEKPGRSDSEEHSHPARSQGYILGHCFSSLLAQELESTSRANFPVGVEESGRS